MTAGAKANLHIINNIHFNFPTMHPLFSKVVHIVIL